MAASPLVQKNAFMDRNQAKSPTQQDPLGSPNKLIQPKLDVEPEQPLFGKNELAKSELLQSPGATGDNQSKLLQTAMKMKDQNTKLKTQLKELKQTLKDTLTKVQVKNKQNAKSMEGEDSELKLELDDNQKQIVIFKKEIQAMKNRLEGLQNTEKVTKMENLLKDKNRQIDDMSQEKRNLEKTKANQDQELDRFQKEFGYEKRIANMENEAKTVREKIKKTQNLNKGNEKIFKNQQEYLVQVSNQYRIICDKLGIGPSLNFTRAEDLTNLMNQKQKEKKEIHDELNSFKTTAASQKNSLKKSTSPKGPKESLKDSKDTKPIQPTQANIKNLEATIENLKAQTDTLEKDYAKEIAEAQAQKKEALAKLKEIETRLKDKEKEASILAHRSHELKRIVRFNAVRPLNGETI